VKIQRDTVSTGKEVSPLSSASKAIVKGDHGPVASPGTTGETNVTICLKVTITRKLKAGLG
jgi:hypothetical protein